MAILYVAAEAAELKPFANYLTGLRPLKWPLDYAQEGILDGRRVLLAANGAGPKLAAQAVEIAMRAVSAADLASSHLEAVFSVGFCGALDPSLRENQIIVASQVVEAGGGESFACTAIQDAPEIVSGVVLSQDRVAVTAAEKEKLYRQTEMPGAVAVEMEAAGVARRTKRADLPFGCIKVVSDRADETFGFDLNAMRSKDGHIARGKIILGAMRRPLLVPELLRLRGRSGKAAQVLGDFLVSCRIFAGSGDELNVS
jgi:adenosylhomocysteine nucleosidase